MEISEEEQSHVPYYLLVTYLLKEMNQREELYQTTKANLEQQILGIIGLFAMG